MPSRKEEVKLLNSVDNTPTILDGLSNLHDWIKAIRFTRNFGKEVAMTAGLDFATGDALVFMDADLQHPPDVIRLFLEHWQHGPLLL